MVCNACQKLNSDGVSFCEFCGADMRSNSSPAPARAATQLPAPTTADVAQIGKSFLNSLTLGEKTVGAGAVAAILGFFLPIVSIPEKAVEAIAPLLAQLGQTGGLESIHASISLFDLTKLLGVVYLVLLLAIISGVLLFVSRDAAPPKKLLIGGFQVLIGALSGPQFILSLIFVPTMGTFAGAGFWLLGLGFTAIAAGGLMTIANLGKTAR